MGQKYSKYVIIAILLFFLWVYSQGTIEKILFSQLVPIEVPPEFNQINSWLEEQKEDFKVIWLPPQFDARILDWARDRMINDFITLSSGKPTLGTQAPYSKLYYLFFETAINNVPKIDKFFDILNSKYLILRTDLPEDYREPLLESLEKNPDLEKIKKGGYLTVFENKTYAPHFWVPENLSLVVGGMETLDILNSRPDFNPINSGLIFVNQQPNILAKIIDLKFKDIIFNNANPDDLLFALVEEKYLIGFAPFTQEGKKEWRKASTQEPLHGEWHRVIDTLRVSNWDFDFGKSLIYSENEGEEIKVPFQIENEGKYFLIVRYFQNNNGGKFKLRLGNDEKIIETLNLNNKFTTQTFNLDSAEKGENTLILQNSIGFNAVNLVALVPEKEYQGYQKRAEEILKNNKIVCAQKITPEMNIQPLEFDLGRPTDYEIFLRLRKIQDRTDEKKDEIEKDDQSEKREGVMDIEELEKEESEKALYFRDKKYDFTLDPSSKSNWLNLGQEFLGQNERISTYLKTKAASVLTVKDFIILDQGNLEFQEKTEDGLEIPIAIKIFNLLPQAEDSEGSEVSDRKGRLITQAIRVKAHQNFYLEYKFEGINLKGVDARVLFYGEDYDPIYQRTAFKTEYFMENQVGNVEKKKVSHFFGTPGKTHYIKIEFKSAPNFEEDSYFQITDLKLYDEENLKGINALIFSEERKAPEEIRIQPVIEYEKINPTKYKVSFSKAEEPFILAFAESYDPLWKLKEESGAPWAKPFASYFSADGTRRSRIIHAFIHGQSPWPSAEAGKRGYLRKRFDSLFSPDDNQISSFPLYSVINGFYIDPQQIEGGELILEYEPQNWFEIGLGISGTGIVLSLTSFLIYYLIKRKRDKD